MNPEMTRTQAHHYEENPLQHQGVGLHSGGHEDDQHEKKSVMKRVKAKAKKIKDTIGNFTKQGHDHDHDRDQDEDQDLDEEDDYDEALEEDPEVHGAPMYDSAAAIGNSGQPRINLDQPPIAGIGNSGQPPINLDQSPISGLHNTAKDEPVNSGQPQINLDQSPISGLHKTRKDELVNSGPPRTDLDQSPISGLHKTAQDETVNSGPPRTNLGQSPISGLHKTAQDETVNSGPPRTNLGQSPIPGLHNTAKDETVNSGQPQINLGQSPPLPEDPHAPKDHGPGAFSSPGNYQTKVTDPTGAGGKEANVEPVIRSFEKMGVKDETEPEHKSFSGTGSHDQFSRDSSSIGTKSIPENPQHGTQTFDQTKPEHHHPEDMNVDQEPRIQGSSYTEKLSYATSAIAGTAISAKNVVASKLGYGGKDGEGVATSGMKKDGEGVATSGMKKDGEGEHTAIAGKSAVGEYGRQISSTVTEKLAPVFDKVAGAGTAVVSKVQGTVSGTNTGTGEGTGTQTHTGTETGSGMTTAKEQDKGVSVKDYLQEKFSPGEEDMALSQVISDALHKRKEDYPEHVAKSMEKVTESPEVASRLGTDDYENKEGDSGDGSGSGNQTGNNKGMVDRVKGVVTSWFGKGAEPAADQVRPTESSRSPDSLRVDEQEHVSGAPAAGSGVGHEGAGTAAH